MAKVKVRDVISDQPSMPFNAGPLRLVDIERVWANYDEVTDSLVIYTTGEPVRGINVLLDDNTYVIVDPKTHDAVGLYIEAWEERFVPAHKEVNEAWPPTRQSLRDDAGWSHLLRMLAFWLLGSIAPGNQPPEARLSAA